MNTSIIRTHVGSGTYGSHVAMVRLVDELMDHLREAGLSNDADHVAADNIKYAFLKELPKKVSDELLHG